MPDGIAMVVVILAAGLSLAALFVTMAVLFPQAVRRIHLTAADAPGWSFLVGLVNLLFLGAILFGLLALAEGAGARFLIAPAIVVLSILVILLTFGLTGVVQLVADRLLPERTELARMGWAGAILILASLFPFIGWFGLFPYLGILGLGAFILSFFRRPAGERITVSDPEVPDSEESRA